MRILLPYHLGCGNRGCEGIARGISKILDLKKEQLILFDISPEDYAGDMKLRLNEIGELKCLKQNKPIEIVRLVCRVFQKIGIPYFYEQLMSSYYVSQATPEDFIFITGGDIYCYEGAATLPNLIVKKAKKRGIKTVLFGVSMEKRFLSEKVVEGLKNFDLITTRETLSKEILEQVGLESYLYPDPAFSLNSVSCKLPDFFQKTVVGINFSPFTDTDAIFEENMNRVIQYILSQGMEVCFIPHVFWKEQDDRKSIEKYTNKFGNHTHLLDSENMSYLQIRYAISKCRYFIGGRTHSVISAYSTQVPCIALGYSVKAKGIARDIGMPDYTVVDSKKLESETKLLDVFMKLEADYDKIKQIYTSLDDYISGMNGEKESILNLSYTERGERLC